MILVSPSVVILVAAALLALPAAAAADGIMLVQAGAFWMGRDDGSADEAPLHRVYVRDFWIERHKVTNAEFAQFLNATGLRPPGSERRYDEDDADARIHRAQGRWVSDSGFERHPVVEVSWVRRARLLRVEGAPAADRGRVGEGRAWRRSAAL